ncbi:MAG: choice-of-anchor tandem repeat GloVer-containing protein [Isosphaerales bacterium]
MAPPPGILPYAGLIRDSGGNLYGTTEQGGASNDGTVFELAQGSGTITVLASFNGTNGCHPYDAPIMDSSGNLYGATFAGGASSHGTVFELAKGSGKITTLASFNGTDGEAPQDRGSLIMDSGGNLYGTTLGPGYSGYGTVFELAQGSGTITTLASFVAPNGTNPSSGLIMDSSGNLYGTASEGGASGDGTVFELAQDSGALTALASFNGTDGLDPVTGLIIDSSGNLYGTAAGGTSNDGTVFELAPGSGTITTLATFNGANGSGPSALIMDSSGNLYGTSSGGGTSNDGTVFELAKGSGTITTLASFNGTNGAGPSDALIIDSSGNLYGTTANGGALGDGTVFELAHGKHTITALASFNGTNGAGPEDALIMDSSGNLYGTTVGGGSGDGYGTVFELTGAAAKPALQISGSHSSTGAGASATSIVAVPNAVGTTDTGSAGTADFTSNERTANLTANDTAPDMGTSPFSGVVPQKKSKPSSTDTLFSAITGSLGTDLS